MTADVMAYVENLPSPKRRQDAAHLVELMRRVTGEEPRLWGTVIGFGQYHYRYASGREGDGAAAGFAPRKAALTIYLPDGVSAHADLLNKLGSHTTGVGCVYIKDLQAVDLGVLETIVAQSYVAVTDEAFASSAPDSG